MAGALSSSIIQSLCLIIVSSEVYFAMGEFSLLFVEENFCTTLHCQRLEWLKGPA